MKRNIHTASRWRTILALTTSLAASSCGPTVGLDEEYTLNAANGEVKFETGWEQFEATLGPRAQLHAIFDQRVVAGDEVRAELTFNNPFHGQLDLFITSHCDSGPEPEFSKNHCQLRDEPERCVVEHTFAGTYGCFRVALYNPTDEPISFEVQKLRAESISLDTAAQ